MDRAEIENIAKLAKLHIEDDQIDEAIAGMSNILELVEQLSSADTKNVIPMAHPLDALQRLRADEISENNVRDEFQAIAPETENGLFLVPKVID